MVGFLTLLLVSTVFLIYCVLNLYIQIEILQKEVRDLGNNVARLDDIMLNLNDTINRK